MWLLPSLQRPYNLQRFINHYRQTDASTPVVVWINEDDPHRLDYERLDYPPQFQLVVDRPMYVGEIMKSFFERWPDLPYYGYLSDDVIPKTLHWDKKLIDAAGDWGMSYPNDMMPTEEVARMMRLHPKNVSKVRDWRIPRFPELQTEKDPNCNFPVIGGELVRAVGWLMVDQIKHFCTDSIWQFIALKLGVNRYCPTVCLEHMHMDFGKSDNDYTYRSKRGGDLNYGRNLEGVERDNEEMRKLITDADFLKRLEKIKRRTK